MYVIFIRVHDPNIIWNEFDTFCSLAKKDSEISILEEKIQEDAKYFAVCPAHLILIPSDFDPDNYKSSASHTVCYGRYNNGSDYFINTSVLCDRAEPIGRKFLNEVKKIISNYPGIPPP